MNTVRACRILLLLVVVGSTFAGPADRVSRLEAADPNLVSSMDRFARQRQQIEAQRREQRRREEAARASADRKNEERARLAEQRRREAAQDRLAQKAAEVQEAR